MARTTWRIGELAQATGLTVRTLHHYEHLGLLAPSRTERHQRVYDEDDVRRLYRIRALRDLGLSLADMTTTLEGANALGDVLRAQRSRVEAELARLTRLHTLVVHACTHADDVPADEVLATIEAMSLVSRRGRGRAGGEARWRALGDELRACMDAGDLSTSERVRALAREAQAGIAAFAGGDRATLDALAHLRAHAPPRDLAGWDPALMRYLDAALRSMKE